MSCALAQERVHYRYLSPQQKVELRRRILSREKPINIMFEIPIIKSSFYNFRTKVREEIQNGSN